MFGSIASLWVIQGIRASIGMARLPWLSKVTPISSSDAPMISVIFAARDEAEKLPAALATLLAQDYLHDYEYYAQSLKASPVFYEKATLAKWVRGLEPSSSRLVGN